MSNKLTREDVRKIAQLARLESNPSDEFLDKFTKDLGSILEYIDVLQSVDTDGISPLDGVRTITIEELREDKVDPDQEGYLRTRNNIIRNFPTKQGDLLILPGIFEE